MDAGADGQAVAFGGAEEDSECLERRAWQFKEPFAAILLHGESTFQNEE